MGNEGDKGKGDKRREDKNTAEKTTRTGAAGEKSGDAVSSNSIAESEIQAGMFLDSPIWLSTKEAAIYLRKFRKIDGRPSEGAIRNAIWRRQLKARKWRRRLYFKRADLDRLLQNSPSIDRSSAWA